MFLLKQKYLKWFTQTTLSSPKRKARAMLLILLNKVSTPLTSLAKTIQIQALNPGSKNIITQASNLGNSHFLRKRNQRFFKKFLILNFGAQIKYFWNFQKLLKHRNPMIDRQKKISVFLT